MFGWVRRCDPRRTVYLAGYEDANGNIYVVDELHLDDLAGHGRCVPVRDSVRRHVAFRTWEQAERAARFVGNWRGRTAFVIATKNPHGVSLADLMDAVENNPLLASVKAPA